MLQKSIITALALGTALVSVSASAQDVTANLQIEGTVENSCMVQPTALTGLSFNGLNQNQGAGASVGVTCNAGTEYSLSPGEGLNFGAGPRPTLRHLADGNGNYIPYELFQGFSDTVWGEDGNAITGVGTGENVWHEFSVSFYDVNLAPGGSYSDVVVQTVTYN